MIKLISDTIDKSDIKALSNWLLQTNTPRLTKGPLTAELEEEWAKKIGTRFSVFVNSGSSAILILLAALKYLGLENKKIVIPALSWSTDLSSAILLGYEPILCDSNLHDLSCDLDHLEKIFKRDKPAALLLVSVLGLIPNMQAVVALCKQYDVLLLEDACEGIGSKCNDKYLGTYGHASTFSMFFGHQISTMEGGFVNTNNRELYNMLLMLRSHGWTRDLTKTRQAKMRQVYKINKFNDMYTFYVPGMNLRSTDLQAFLGLRAIKKLNKFSAKRALNYMYYLNLASDISMVTLKNNSRDLVCNFAFPLVVKDRNKVLKNLKDKVETRPLIAGNLALHPVWKNYGSTLKDELPNATMLHEHGLYLPNHQNISKKDIETVVSIIKNT